jgi:hypothetical protein
MLKRVEETMFALCFPRRVPRRESQSKGGQPASWRSRHGSWTRQPKSFVRAQTLPVRCGVALLRSVKGPRLRRRPGWEDKAEVPRDWSSVR